MNIYIYIYSIRFFAFLHRQITCNSFSFTQSCKNTKDNVINAHSLEKPHQAHCLEWQPCVPAIYERTGLTKFSVLEDAFSVYTREDNAITSLEMFVFFYEECRVNEGQK